MALLKHPLVVSEPINCFFNGLTDSEFRVPARFSHLGRIQKDEWVIAYPPLFPAGKFQSWIHFESLTDPRHRVFHRTILFGTEIINLALMVCESRCLLVYHVKDRVQTILHVKVRLPLITIPEHPETGWVGYQLPIKIEDMTVGVAFAQD